VLFQPREPPAAAGCEPQTRQRPSEIVPEAQYGGTGRALEPPGQTGRPRPADEGCGSVPIRGTAPRLDVMEPGTKAEPIPVQRCGRPHQRLVRPDLLPLRAPRGQRQPRLTACGTAPCRKAAAGLIGARRHGHGRPSSAASSTRALLGRPGTPPPWSASHRSCGRAPTACGQSAGDPAAWRHRPTSAQRLATTRSARRHVCQRQTAADPATCRPPGTALPGAGLRVRLPRHEAAGPSWLPGRPAVPHDEISSRPLVAGPCARTAAAGRACPLAAAAPCP
jgi:hypothetical protein